MPPIAEMIACPSLVAQPAAQAARKGVQWASIGLGWMLVAAGFVIAPLPGPFGLPIGLVGLTLVLRSSPSARRGFIRMKRRHPKVLSPIRHLMRSRTQAALWRRFTSKFSPKAAA